MEENQGELRRKWQISDKYEPLMEGSTSNTTELSRSGWEVKAEKAEKCRIKVVVNISLKYMNIMPRHAVARESRYQLEAIMSCIASKSSISSL